MPFFRNSIYTVGFWLMCLSSFLFFASFNMLLPELPDFLTKLGGADYKGFIIALFTLTAGFSRPFSGKLADTVGRIPVMVFGSLVCFLCGFFYPWVTTVTGFLLLRLLHGFSTGFKPTGTAAFIADIIPLERRGEAMGLLGVAGSLGMAAGPVVGSLITDRFSLGTMFYCSSGAALLSLCVQGTLTETLPVPQRERFSWRLLRLDWSEVLEPQVLAPAVVTLLCMFSYGTVLTVLPDQSGLMHINKGLFFTCFTVASLLVRLLAGRSSDRYGRVPVLRVSTAILVVALATLAIAQSPAVLLTAAVLFGLGSGLNSPTLYAWTIDLSNDMRRGRAVATMYIALEAGIGIGALLAGWVYGNVPSHLPYVHAMGMICSLMALAYLFWGVRARQSVPA